MKRQPLKEDLELARRAAAVIRRLHPDAEIILYGSRARGNPEKESDLDLLVITDRKLSVAEEILIDKALLPVEIQAAVVICPILEHRSRWYSNKIQVIPLAQAIRSEGVRL